MHAFFLSVVPLDEICLLSLGLMKHPGKIMMSTIFLDSAPLSSISDYAFMTSNQKTYPIQENSQSGDPSVEKEFPPELDINFYHISCHGSGIPFDTQHGSREKRLPLLITLCYRAADRLGVGALCVSFEKVAFLDFLSFCFLL